jgi:hypothetical protein
MSANVQGEPRACRANAGIPCQRPASCSWFIHQHAWRSAVDVKICQCCKRGDCYPALQRCSRSRQPSRPSSTTPSLKPPCGRCNHHLRSDRAL